MQRLNRLAELAKSASLYRSDQIERIIQMTEDATDRATKTVEIIKRLMNRQD